MGIILKLEQGPDVLNINSGRYCVDDATFSPPTTARSLTFASAAVGSNLQAKKRENRGWAFNVTISGSSPQEAERALRELQSFLGRSDRAEPLYVAYRSFDDYDYEPYFGLHGAFMRYEVVYGTVEVGGQYNTPLTANSKIVNARLSLVIKPQAVGLQMPAGQALGAVSEDYVGKANGLSRGTIMAADTTNKSTNPIFMRSTFNGAWTASGVSDTANKDPNYILYGDTSARLVRTGATALYTQTLNVGNTNTHVVSFYVKLGNSGAIGTSISCYFNTAAITTNRVSVGDGWYFCWGTFTGAATNRSIGIEYTSIIDSVYFDGFQVEDATVPSALCHGDQLGCSWSGTKNSSTSSRDGTGPQLRYKFDDVLGVRAGFTIRVVWMPMYSSGYSQEQFFSDDSADIRAYLDSSLQYQFTTDTSSGITSAAVTITPGTPEVLHFNFDGTTANIYRNGALLQTGSTTLGTDALTYMYVGNWLASLQVNATIMGFATFLTVMSADEISADYDSLIQQATDGDRIDPLPYVWTVAGDSVFDNDNASAETNYGVVGGLMGDDVDVDYQVDSDSDFITRPGMIWGSLPVAPRVFDKDILTDGGTNTLLFLNGSGTANTSANGDAVQRLTSLTTTIQNGPITAITSVNANILANARSVVGYFVGVDGSAVETVQVQLCIRTSGDIDDAHLSPWRTIATDTSLRPYVTHELPLFFEPEILDGAHKVGFSLRFRRTTGTANFDISHTCFFINYSALYSGDLGSTGTPDTFYVSGRSAYSALNADQDAYKARRTLNRPLLLTPEMLNVINFQHTYRHQSSQTTTWASSADTTASLEIEQMGITPRFDIF